MLTRSIYDRLLSAAEITGVIYLFPKRPQQICDRLMNRWISVTVRPTQGLSGERQANGQA